jgi:hypothetical protein
MATSFNGADPNWYLNSGMTDHITGELEKLTMHERYNNNDQIRTVNGAGMDIVHIGKSVLPSPTRDWSNWSLGKKDKGTMGARRGERKKFGIFCFFFNF